MASLLGFGSRRPRPQDKDAAASARFVGDYEVLQTLGSGSQSKVKLGRHRVTGERVALKMIPVAAMDDRETQQELAILRHFGEVTRHPNVSGMVAHFHDVPLPRKHPNVNTSDDDENAPRRVCVIATEYMDAGDLFSYVCEVPFDEDTAQAVFQQLVRGVSHLHREGVVHLDIKLENILLNSRGNVKVTDFGLSEIVLPLRRPRRSSKHAHLLNSSSVRRLQSTPTQRPQDRKPRADTVSSGSGSNAGLPLPSQPSLASLASTPSGEGSAGSRASSLLEHHFPPPLPRRASPTEEEESPTEPRSPHDEEALLAEAIRCGRTRASLLREKQQREAEEDVRRRRLPAQQQEQEQQQQHLQQHLDNGEQPQPEPAGQLEQALSVRLSRSMNNLASLVSGSGASGRSSRRGLGRRRPGAALADSYNSLQSLGSAHSARSRASGRSGPRFLTPRLVVNSRSGTLMYQAPEVAKGNYCGARADVFSLGVVLHVMLYGVLPFSDGEWVERRDYYSSLGRLQQHQQQQHQHQQQEQQHEQEPQQTVVEPPLRPWKPPPRGPGHHCEVSADAQDLLAGMLCLSPESRLTMKDVERHPWVLAAQVFGAAARVAAVVKRRKAHVIEERRRTLEEGKLARKQQRDLFE